MNATTNNLSEEITSTEKKPKLDQIAIRLPSEDRDRFTSFCKENNLSQSEALQHLLDTYKVQHDAEQNPEQAENFRRFQHNLQALLTIYTDSVMCADDARGLARQECADELAQSSQTIQALEAQVTTLHAKLTSVVSEKDQLEKNLQISKEHASIVESQYEQALSQLSDKANLLSILEAKLPETDSLLAELEALRTTERNQKDEISSLRHTLQQAKLEHAEELRRLDNDHAAELRVSEAEKHKAQEALARAEAQVALLQAKTPTSTN